MVKEKEEQAKEVKEEVKTEEPSEEKKAKELEFKGDPFGGSKMEDWMKESGLSLEEPFSPTGETAPEGEKPPESETKEEEKKEEEKKEVSSEKEPSKEDKKEPSKDEKTKPEEKKEPYAVLEVDGKDFEVATEDEYIKLAQQGLSSTQRWQEASQIKKESEGYRNEVLDMRHRILQLEDQLNNPPRTREKVEEEDYGTLDPEYREELKKRDERIDRLEKAGQESQTVQMKADYERARVDMDRNIDVAMKAHPFEEIKIGERNVSEELYAGLVTTKFNEDRMRAANDPRHQSRMLDVITKEAAQDLQTIDGFYKEKYSSSDGGEVTKEQLSEKYPDEIKSLVQEGITAYLDDKDKAPPSPKSTHGKVEATESKVKEGDIDHMFAEAKKDPEVTEGIGEFVKQIKRTS